MRRPLLTALTFTSAALLISTALLLPLDAQACGGCFSPPGQQNNQLVLQNAERVLFHQDPLTKKSTVWVEVRYSGLAKDFGWVLPVPKMPTVSVGSSWVFDQLDGRHAPRFSTSTESSSENCRSWQNYCFGPTASQGGADGAALSSDASSGAFDDGGGGGGNGGGVTVLKKDQAGPYDYEILASKDPKALLDWLNKNGYDTPAKALPIIKSHLLKGDLFVAVKLQSSAGVNEVKPIVLEMDNAESCVPLRLTSIAATDNMSVVVTLAGPGRAIPKNHMHVKVNPLKLNWFRNGINYPQVLSAAIDEAAGRAFVTEYSGAGRDTALIGPNNRMTATPFKVVTSATGLAVALQTSRLILTKDSIGILENITGLAKLSGRSPQSYYSQLRNCGYNRANNRTSSWCTKQLAGPSTLPVDGPKLATALDKEFIQPILKISDALVAAPRLTRLVMRISPDEMDRDPIFAFNPALPDVANTYSARFTRVCSTGWTPYDSTRLTISGSGSYVFKGTIPNDFSGTGSIGNNAVDKRFVDAPMALAVELLDETGGPRPIADSQIELVDTAIAGATVGKLSLPKDMVLKPVTERWTLPASDERRTFVQKRDDSQCTTKHAVKPWIVTAGEGGAGGSGGGGGGGGCTASGSPVHSGTAGWLLAFGAALLLWRRRRRLA